MENERNKDLPEQMLPDPDTPENPEQAAADLEAQKWLDTLLASSEDESFAVDNFDDSIRIPESLCGDWPDAEAAPVTEPDSQIPPLFTEDTQDSISMADMSEEELDRIIQEAMSQEWGMADIEQEIMSAPPEAAGTVEHNSDLYTDGGELPDSDQEPERKVRPKRKQGYGLFGLPHLISTAIWAAICITIGISLGRLIWVCAADILAFGRPDKDVEITITAEEATNLDALANKLYSAGLIEYKELFKAYANLANVIEKGKISQGTFHLNTMYDYHALVGGMSPSSSYRSTTKVVIPEGYTCAQIFARLEEAGVCTAAELEQYCITSEFSNYWFLEDVEKGTKYCLEGFLFPDTYEFYIDSTPKEVFIKLLASFENHFDAEMVAQLEVLNATLKDMYKSNGASDRYVPLTVHDIVIIASMIEKETAYSGESPTIASVIYNRITDPYDYPYLNIDATVVYALGGKTDLTREDLQIDHPYNTYRYEGLTPGAISNPGYYSLKAALFPAETDYHFYALDPTAEFASHKFFKTLREHEAFLESLR